MKLINADALLKKTINNPLHVPYITKKDVIDMPSALNNQVNLCDSCTYTYPECPSEKDDVIFGNGIGNDNICACNKYQPTIQPERKKGEWIEISSINHTYKCSECGRLLVNVADGKNNVSKHYPYCHCGADMKGERQK